MKAVIALSGLAGLVLFGLPHLHSQSPSPSTVVARTVVHVPLQRVRVQGDCRFEAPREITIPAGSVQDLRLLAGAGSLDVVGVEGLNEIRARGRACASEEGFLEDIQLSAETRGGTAVLESHYPDLAGWGGWRERYARLDLAVEVPVGMTLDVKDGSGDLTMAEVGAVVLEDGSGSVEIRDANGDVEIQDGSGEIALEGVRGSVHVEDGSGEILLRGVSGDVDITDSSGEVVIEAVEGSVTLSDSSGEIDLRDVTGSVHVRRDSSGDIRVRGVGGDFVVERDGSGDIRFSDVKGRVDIPRRKRRG